MTKEHIATCTNLINFNPTLYSSVLVIQHFKIVQSLYNHSPLLFLNARYTGATPTFSIEGLHFVTNV